MEQPKYVCSNCGMAVIVIPNEKPIKACKCENTTIVANMEATVIRCTGGIKA
jgi:DNA-directed RNA polymerase subunit RPC12/RpoP